MVRPRIEPLNHPPQLGVGLGGLAPVVGRAGFFLGRRAYEGELLGARDVVGIGTMEVAVGALLVIERDEDALAHGLLGEALTLGLGAIAPDDVVRLHKLGHSATHLVERAAFSVSSAVQILRHPVVIPWGRGIEAKLCKMQTAISSARRPHRHRGNLPHNRG